MRLAKPIRHNNRSWIHIERTPFAEHLPSLKLTVTWKWMVGIGSFPSGKEAYLQGLRLREGVRQPPAWSQQYLGFFAGLPWPKSILSNTGSPKMATSSRCRSEPMVGLHKAHSMKKFHKKSPLPPQNHPSHSLSYYILALVYPYYQ